MKIYIDKLNLDILNELSNKLKNIKVKTEYKKMIYTNYGIYQIDTANVYQLYPVDRHVTKYNNFHNIFSLIVDESYFTKERCYTIKGNQHLEFKIERNIYKKNNSSELQLVIEFNHSNPYDIYFERSNKIYGEDVNTYVNMNMDINDNKIKQEIIEFLSELN